MVDTYYVRMRRSIRTGKCGRKNEGQEDENKTRIFTGI
jgi:hypothetical protein